MRLYVCDSKDGAETEQDLIEIWIYIAQNNPEAADRVLDDIDERFHALADNPLQQPKIVLPYPKLQAIAVLLIND